MTILQRKPLNLIEYLTASLHVGRLKLFGTEFIWMMVAWSNNLLQRRIESTILMKTYFQFLYCKIFFILNARKHNLCHNFFSKSLSYSQVKSTSEFTFFWEKLLSCLKICTKFIRFCNWKSYIFETQNSDVKPHIYSQFQIRKCIH